MFSKILKRVLAQRKRAIRSGIPKNILKLLDYEIDKALFCRRFNSKFIKNVGYRMAMEHISFAQDILDAHLTKRFYSYKNSLLKGILKGEIKDHDNNCTIYGTGKSGLKYS